MFGKLFVAVVLIIAPTIGGIVSIMSGWYFGAIYFIVPIFTIMLFLNPTPADTGRNYNKGEPIPKTNREKNDPLDGMVSDMDIVAGISKSTRNFPEVVPEKKTKKSDPVPSQTDYPYPEIDKTHLGKTGYPDLDENEREAHISFLASLLASASERRDRRAADESG